jgi:hypothetical protein
MFTLAVGVVSGAVVLQPAKAGASTGYMVYGGNNDAGQAQTSLTTSEGSGSYTLSLNDSGQGGALLARSTSSLVDSNCADFEKTGPGGGVTVYSEGDRAGLAVTRNNSAVAGAAIDATSDVSGPVYRATSQPQCGEPLFVGVHHGYGAGMQLTLESTTSTAHVIDATQGGKGAAIVVSITNTASGSTCVKATTAGTGQAVYGDGGAHGRGATLVSNVAQLRLAPGTLASHPASGAPGDLYVDKTTRLWFCKGGSSWHQLA